MAQQPPPGPPPAAPPPPPAGYGPGYGAARPAGGTGAGVMLIITGVIWVLLGLIVGIAGGAIIGDFGGAGGAVIGVAVVLAAMGVLDIISGVRVMGGNNGWKIGGIVLTAIGSLLSLLFLLGSFSGQEEVQFDPNTFEFTTVSAGPNVGGLIFSLILLALNAVALIMTARVKTTAVQ